MNSKNFEELYTWAITLSYLMRDETLDPRALSIPANSMAIYPAPTTATFLKKKKYIYIYIIILFLTKSVKM